MTLTTPPSIHDLDFTMSYLLNQLTHDGTHMQIDPIEANSRKPLQENNEDEFSDFEADPEELEIIEQLLQEAAAKHTSIQDAPLVVTDIEDYEAPRGVRLPKVFGQEITRQWNHQSQVENQQLESGVVQIIRNQSGKPCFWTMSFSALLLLTLLTSD